MKAVILAGGLGTRISEETHLKPKPMIEIGGRPILWHIMKIYSHYGINDFVVCLGYKGYLIKDFFLNYEARMKDFTVRLGSPPSLEFHGAHAEEGWSVTLAEAGDKQPTLLLVTPPDGGARLYPYSAGKNGEDATGVGALPREVVWEAPGEPRVSGVRPVPG